MVDLLYILTIIAFFALMVLFVKWCEHIIGKDDAVDLPYDDAEGNELADRSDTHTEATKEEVSA